MASQVRVGGRPQTERSRARPPLVAVTASPDAARSQSEEAYLRIRDRIVCLEMAPGSVVQEARLREELEIGRTAIREALPRPAPPAATNREAIRALLKAPQAGGAADQKELMNRDQQIHRQIYRAARN